MKPKRSGSSPWQRKKHVWQYFWTSKKKKKSQQVGYEVLPPPPLSLTRLSSDKLPYTYLEIFPRKRRKCKNIEIEV